MFSTVYRNCPKQTRLSLRRQGLVEAAGPSGGGGNDDGGRKRLEDSRKRTLTTEELLAELVAVRQHFY